MRLAVRAVTAALLTATALAPALPAEAAGSPLVCPVHQMMSPNFPYGGPVWITSEGDVLVRVGYDLEGRPVYEMVYDCPPYDGS